MNKKTSNKLVSKLTKTIILTMIVFALFSTPANTANADELSTDLTENLIYASSNGRSPASVVDGNYASYWYTKKAAYQYVQFESSEPIKHFYVCYAFKPEELSIQTSNDGLEWVDFATENPSEYYHVTYTFDEPVNYVKIRGSNESMEKFGVVEVKAFSDGTLPDYAQNWQPTHEKADLMIFSAHTDDEAVFFAGLIPYYAGGEGKNVVTVYMTASDPCRRSEALNYNWKLNQSNLPMFAYFTDVYEEYTSNYTKSVWKEDKTIDYMVKVIREKKPEVIVSHDLNGEYGHGNHIFTAECLLKAVELANDPGYHLESYDLYGTHEIKKLYLHLYHENKIHLDILDEPLEAYDGLSAIEISKIALEEYASQIRYTVVRVHDDESEFSCYKYGLAYTTVGYDTEGTDMFENTQPEPTATPQPTPSPTLSPTPTADASTATPTIQPETKEIGNNILNLGKTTIIFICIAAGIIFIICIWLIVLLLR